MQLCTFHGWQVIHLGWQPLLCMLHCWHNFPTTHPFVNITIILPLFLFYHYCLINGISLSWNNIVRFAKNGFQELCNILTDQNVLRLQRKNVSLIHINAMNTFAVVPSADVDNGSTKDYLNALEKYCYWQQDGNSNSGRRCICWYWWWFWR